ncbi:MAG: hypothetical protein ACRDTF_07995, partial [Pseudonocardiaceae bacterium]
MTQNHPTNVEQATNAANGTGARRAADPAPRELGELLDRLSETALRFLAAAPRPPRNLRMRAGEVSVDIKWVGEHAVDAAGMESAPAAPVAVPTTAPELSVSYLIAQTVGVFYRAPEPGAAPFVNA